MINKNLNLTVKSLQVIKDSLWITRISKQGHSYECHCVVIDVYHNYNGINIVRKESKFEIIRWLPSEIGIYEACISITLDNKSLL